MGNSTQTECGSCACVESTRPTSRDQLLTKHYTTEGKPDIYQLWCNAIENGNYNSVMKLISQISEYNLLNYEFPNGDCPLSKSIKLGHNQIVSLLLGKFLPKNR